MSLLTLFSLVVGLVEYTCLYSSLFSLVVGLVEYTCLYSFFLV